MRFPVAVPVPHGFYACRSHDLHHSVFGVAPLLLLSLQRNWLDPTGYLLCNSKCYTYLCSCCGVVIHEWKKYMYLDSFNNILNETVLDLMYNCTKDRTTLRGAVRMGNFSNVNVLYTYHVKWTLKEQIGRERKRHIKHLMFLRYHNSVSQWITITQTIF